MGVAEAGHYLSYINIDRERGDDTDWAESDKQKWLDFNDSNVKEMDFAKVMEEKCFGSKKDDNAGWQYDDQTNFAQDNSHNAYMLIYEKRLKTDMKIDLSEETI